MKKSSKKQCSATTEDAADEGCSPTRDIVRIVDAEMLPWLFTLATMIRNIETPAEEHKICSRFGIGGANGLTPTTPLCIRDPLGRVE